MGLSGKFDAELRRGGLKCNEKNFVRVRKLAAEMYRSLKEGDIEKLESAGLLQHANSDLIICSLYYLPPDAMGETFNKMITLVRDMVTKCMDENARQQWKKRRPFLLEVIGDTGGGQEERKRQVVAIGVGGGGLCRRIW
ncbi:MAG: hypothetical protein JNK24_07970 [Alphaproteobacteria bacterium]|nr:hypothetical protein [Alphaproteobacteria bacterium]